MMRTLRKTAMLFLAVCMSVCAVCAASFGHKVKAADSERNALRFSISMDNADFDSDTFTQLSDDAYLAILTTPFPCTSTDVGEVAFKGAGDFLASWWDGIGSSFTVEYEYALSVPFAGAGSPIVHVDKEPWVYGQGPVDQDGNAALDINEDIELVSNGWRKRTITYDTSNAITDEKAVLQDVSFAMPLRKGDLPESGTVDFFLKSLRFNFRGTWYSIYDSTDPGCFWIKAVHSSFTSELTPEIRFFENSGGVITQVLEDKANGIQFSESLHYGGTWTEEPAPDFVSMSESQARPAAIVQGSEYDLTSFMNTSDGSAVTVKEVKNNGTAVDVSDPTKFVPAEAGTYTIVYTATADYTTTKSITLPCEKAGVPVFDPRDVDAAVPATGYAHQPISVSKVMAMIGGQKTLDTTLEVRKNSEDGETMEVTDGGDSWSFDPTAKENATYFVRFKAVNVDGETYEAYSDWKQIAVTDIDVPTFNFDNMFDSATIGTRYTLEQLTDGMTVTDITDGDITDYTVVIYDPIGDVLSETNGTYFIANSGTHRVVVTASDSDGNTMTGEGTFWASATVGSVFQTTYIVPEEARAAGIQKKDRIHAFEVAKNETIMLVAGSKICYEVMAYTYINGTMTFISGVGGISAQLSPSWNFIDVAISESAVDSNGLGMRPNADLSSALQNEGKAVWLEREYTVTEGDGICGEQFYHLAFAIDTSAEVGEKIYVYFRNLTVVKPNGDIQPIGSATDELVDAWAGEHMNTNITSHNISATIDRYPVYLDGEIPSSVGLGKTVRLSKYVMKDAYLDEFVTDIVYTVTDPNGAPVELEENEEEYSFKATVRGRYKVVLVGTNDIGSTTVELSILADDTEAPTIVKGTFSDAKVGEEFTAAFTVADNVTEPSALDVEVRVFMGSTSVECNSANDNGALTVTFTPQTAGTYRIIVTIIDEAGKETTEQFTVEAAEAQGGTDSETSDTGSDNPSDSGSSGGSVDGGCGCTSATAAGTIPAFACVAAMALVLKRKHR